MSNIDVIDLETDENLNMEQEVDLNIKNNIFYSYPFKEDKYYEYQYRITLDNDVGILDEIKCNDECEIIDEGLILINTIIKLPLDDLKNKIKKNLDLRTNEEFPKNNSVNLNHIPININNKNELKKLDLAKSFCLQELLIEILEEL